MGRGAKRDRAELFKCGGSQAVRLPKPYRFENQDEVVIYRRGNQVILEAKRPRWSDAFLALSGSSKDLPYPEDPPPVEPAPAFD